MKGFLQIKPGHYKQPFSFLISMLQTAARIWIKLNKDAGLARAGSLAYSTLLAAVPLGALIISLMNAFGALESVQGQITDTVVKLLIPTRQAEVSEMLSQFMANSTTLGVVGFVFFTLTSILLLNTINDNLNAVWGSKAKTNFLSKFTTYASVLIFGSLFLAASTTLSSRLTFFDIGSLKIFMKFVYTVAPFLFNFLTIMILIGISPSGKVKFSSICIGSLFGAILWEIMKYSFVNLSSWVMRASIIYGAIAIVPIFLFWIYIIWVIIIASMEVAWLHQFRNKFMMDQEAAEMEPAARMAFGYELYLAIAASFDSGNQPYNNEELSALFSCSTGDISYFTSIFEKNQLLLRAGEDGDRWMPARTLSRIGADEIARILFGNVDTNDARNTAALKQIYKFSSAGLNELKMQNIEELLK